MAIKIFRAGRSHTDRVDPGIAQTEQIVEHDRVQGITQLKQPL